MQAARRGGVPALVARRPAGPAAGRWPPWPTASPSGRPGDLTFALVSKLVDEVVTVSEEDISRALLLLLERAKQVVEPAGAAAVAAVLAGAVRSSHRWSRSSRAATSTRC